MVLSLNAFAFEPIKAEPTDALYIRTRSVPQSATDYAISVFSSLSIENFEALGIKCSSHMKLSPGFCMVNSYNGNFIDRTLVLPHCLLVIITVNMVFRFQRRTMQVALIRLREMIAM